MTARVHGRLRVRRVAEVTKSCPDAVLSRTYVPPWLSQLVSIFGDTVHDIALVVLAFVLTGCGVTVATAAREQAPASVRPVRGLMGSP